jgi:hypothetical protein
MTLYGLQKGFTGRFHLNQVYGSIFNHLLYSPPGTPILSAIQPLYREIYVRMRNEPGTVCQ